MKNQKIFSQQGSSMQVILFLVVIILLIVTAGVYNKQVLQAFGFKVVKITPTASPAPPTPTLPPKKLTADDVKKYIVEAAQLREEGKYVEGEGKMLLAYNRAMELKNPALAVEAGNNLSIQYRLTAGRLNRQGKTAEALVYSQKSLDIFETLQQRGWFSERDPINARSYAHALLYAGKVKEALPALEKSYQLQTDPAAQGDELVHKAAALYSQNRNEEARIAVEEGIKLIENNNGSKVWLSFGLMTKASIMSRLGTIDEAKKLLEQAATIVREHNLIVRKEELEYLLRQDATKIDVLLAVGTPIATHGK